ncbi:MAG: hypothetical protein HYR90_04830 [Candidatus Andersenbacteria bacterium]|nr:hypothetical protein [Candidatus Andersenbacteria bacterium]
MIKELLIGKNANERAGIKVAEISKLSFTGVFEGQGFLIDILSVSKVNGGIEILAKAFKDAKRIGFGDGSVEIERFRIYNPPILIPDLLGNIEQTIESFDGKTRTRKLREDPVEAIRQTLAHTISLVGKKSDNVIVGKVGSTVSTFYPDADPESTSVDGDVRKYDTSDTWANIRALADGTDARPSFTAPATYTVASTTTNQWTTLTRSFYLFDTSSLPDGDNISVAILSLVGGSGSVDNLIDNPDLDIISTTPASNTNLVLGDYDQIGSTVYASMAWNSWVKDDVTYNDFTLDANGIAQISKTGITKFGSRLNRDTDNVAPAWVSNVATAFEWLSADNAGTTTDPKLVVTHAAVSAVKPVSTLLTMKVG